MQIGESTGGSTGISGQNSTTINVPAGEVWKFTFVGMSEGNGDGATDNSSLKVGFADGQVQEHVLSSNDGRTPVVGGYSGAKSIIVDGDHADLAVECNAGIGSSRQIVWSAIRIPGSGLGRGMSGTIRDIPGQEGKTLSIPSGEVWEFTFGAGGAGATNKDFGVGISDGSNQWTLIRSTSNAIPVIGGTDPSNSNVSGNNFVIDGSKHDLWIANGGPFDSYSNFFWSAIQIN